MTGTYILENFLSPEECQLCIDRFLAGKPRPGTIASADENKLTELRRCRVGFADHPIRERLVSTALRANSRFYRYALDGLEEPIQTAEYAEGDHYGWHLDIGSGGTARRKLSVSVQLSDGASYDGGDLEISCSGTAPRFRGSLIAFPSYLAHRVVPVTRGVRYSLVAWLSGPAFR